MSFSCFASYTRYSRVVLVTRLDKGLPKQKLFRRALTVSTIDKRENVRIIFPSQHTGCDVMVDVITSSESFGDSCDILHMNDGVGNWLAGDGISHNALDSGMNLMQENL